MQKQKTLQSMKGGICCGYCNQKCLLFTGKIDKRRGRCNGHLLDHVAGQGLDSAI